MVCNVCGRTIKNEEANFCEYCGVSFREGAQNIYSGNNAYVTSDMQEGSLKGNSAKEPSLSNMEGKYQQREMYQQTGRHKEVDTAEKPMTFANWIMILLLPLIPIIGTIAYLAVLFSWAFGNNISLTKKNWARATLVVIAFLFILMFAFFGGSTGFINSLYGGLS